MQHVKSTALTVNLCKSPFKATPQTAY